MGGGATLPSGTVTFLFTDIERSTQTVEAMGNEAYADALATHRRLVREAFSSRGGHEVGTEGDAFFVAFGRAHDAVDAAVSAQQALEGHALRVRMGLHTGEALVRDGEYIGHDVHKAKRVSDAGHGGQILVSQATAELVRDIAQLVDLGSHRLKDLGEPQRIFQIGAGTFPRLRSLDAFTHSLPMQRSAFIGREKEMAEIRELLVHNRMVTITGVGGCGKTRLAQQVGAEELDRFSDGVFFANLAPVADPDVVAGEIAASVGAAPATGIAGLGAGPSTDEILFSHLGSRRCLVILDNCEHLIDACADLADRILARCPNVTILATSREALRVDGEQTWAIPSLSLPADDRGAQSSESVSLFKARAKAVRPSFDLTPENVDVVVEICRRLDGIPLAIEFAAARVNHLSPRQIAERLDDRFRLLTGGQRRVQRQQTLQAALDWSHDLLSEAERVLLRRLSVFQGTFTLDHAEGVCADDTLSVAAITDVLGSLVSKSLVLAEIAAEPARYHLLETVRVYAAERLTHAEEAGRVRQRHRDWYDKFVSSASWDDVLSSVHLWARLVEERPNLRSAIEWSMASKRHDIVGRMAAHVYSFFQGPAELAEGQRWFAFALQDEGALDPDVRVLCLAVRGLRPQGALTGDTLSLLDRAVAAAPGASAVPVAFALTVRAWMASIVAAATGSADLATRCYHDLEEAGRLASDHPKIRGMVLWFRAQTDFNFNRVDEAREPLEEAVRQLRDEDDVAFGGYAAALFLAVVAHIKGDDHLAAETVERLEANVRPWEGKSSVGGAAIWPPGTDAMYAAALVQVKGVAAAWEFLRDRPAVVGQSMLVLDKTALVLACAIVCTNDGKHAIAAKLLAWYSKAVFRSGWAPRSSADYVLYLHYRDLVRGTLDREVIARAREEGSTMSYEDAIDLALGDKVSA